MLGTILLVILILLLIGGLPNWPHAQAWGLGWTPAGVIAVILVIVVVLLLAGHIRL